MNIVIPTKGRIGRQSTLESIPAENRGSVTLVCPEDEVNRHVRNHPEVRVRAQIPDHTVFQIFQNEIDRCETERIVLMDDDLIFSARRDDDPTKAVRAEKEFVWRHLVEVEGWLSADNPHAGVHVRAQFQGKPRGKEINTRMIHVFGYHVPTVKRLGIRWDRLRCRSDMDACLQLLSLGYGNVVSTELLVDDRGFMSPGGCTDWRTVEMTNREAEVLKTLHPGFVNVVRRTYKGTPDRLENVCHWKKAYAAGMKHRELK